MNAMTFRSSTRRRFYSCTVALLILHEGTVLLAAQRAMMTTRVRSDRPVIVAAIATAAEHSATFRGMVEAVEKTDGIVYVREGACRLGLRACLAGVHSAGPVRFIYITVDTRKAVGCELMASLGHEQQHALEVLMNPKIIDNHTVANFYMRRGATGDDIRFETEAAVRTGLLVEKELHAASMCQY
jgi:hypothetical protein